MVPSEALAKEGGSSKAFPSYGWQANFLLSMHYAYILESISNPGELYRGYTSDLKQRLDDHNNGKCPHTSKFRPWKLRVYVAFEKSECAQRFENI